MNKKMDEMDEEEFREKLIKSLRKKNVQVLNLRKGTLDLYFEDSRTFGEIKKVGKGRAGGIAYKDKKTITEFSKNQTEMIRGMKRKPIVIAFDDKIDGYYLYGPEEVEKLFEHRTGHDKVFWSENAEENPFKKKLLYGELLDRLVELCASKKQRLKQKIKKIIQKIKKIIPEPYFVVVAIL